MLEENNESAGVEHVIFQNEAYTVPEGLSEMDVRNVMNSISPSALTADVTTEEDTDGIKTWRFAEVGGSKG